MTFLDVGPWWLFVFVCFFWFFFGHEGLFRFVSLFVFPTRLLSLGKTVMDEIEGVRGMRRGEVSYVRHENKETFYHSRPV